MLQIPPTVAERADKELHRLIMGFSLRFKMEKQNKYVILTTIKGQVGESEFEHGHGQNTAVGLESTRQNGS